MLDATTVVLAEDGRHVTLGRNTTPDVTEIETSACGLASQGLGGWLCRLEGSYYGRVTPLLVPLQILGEPKTRFDQASARFLDLRRNQQSS